MYLTEVEAPIAAAKQFLMNSHLLAVSDGALDAHVALMALEEIAGDMTHGPYCPGVPSIALEMCHAGSSRRQAHFFCCSCKPDAYV